MQEGVDPQEVVERLFQQGINVKPSAISSSRLDFEKGRLPPVVVRASVHYFNTTAEIDKLVAAVAAVSS